MKRAILKSFNQPWTSYVYQCNKDIFATLDTILSNLELKKHDKQLNIILNNITKWKKICKKHKILYLILSPDILDFTCLDYMQRSEITLSQVIKPHGCYTEAHLLNWTLFIDIKS